MEKQNALNKKMAKKHQMSVPVIALNSVDALDFFLDSNQYCFTELPEYFDFNSIIAYAKNAIGSKSLNDCLKVKNITPNQLNNVNFEFVTNKDGRYGVRPLTLANPFLYYMLARDICEEKSWEKIQECFDLYRNEQFEACAIPQVKVNKKPEAFRGATSILNWWNSMEQTPIELSLKYRYMFISDITNCFGQINPESIDWALARKDTMWETNENRALAKNIQQYLRAMQHNRNVGIPQGSTLFGFIAEIVLGYADMLFAKKIEEAQFIGDLPENLDFKVLRYVDDYRIFCNDRDALDKMSYILQGVLEGLNFRMNTSKTRVSTELIADSIKPDKAYYILNTPIESKQPYCDEDGNEKKVQGYDFDGFQKHLLFIYEFARKFPNAGQLKNMLSAFSKRLEEQLSVKSYTKEILEYDEKLDELLSKTVIEEVEGHLWENIVPMVAIAVQIASENVGVAHYALRVVSQMLADMHKTEGDKKKEVIELIYNKLRFQPNSAFMQIWLQNITHTTDDWTNGLCYDMPLCRLVAKQPISLWNNSWLNNEIVKDFPIDSIVNREILAQTGQVITFKEKRQYDSTNY